ncbi:MAG TPA: flagellar assembly protein FliW [Acidobacteriota bacterium]|nr:flagellar assembly protein FliW [Acidobacteriota bacterium]
MKLAMTQAQELQTIRFGPVSFKEEDIVEFPDGMPGFAKLRRFLLIESPDFQPFSFLQSVEEPSISFPLLPPQAVDSDYHFELPKKDRRSLDLERPEEAAVFCIVTIDEDPSKATVNLFAPVVLNLPTRKAAQVILFNSSYSTATPLLPESA